MKYILTTKLKEAVHAFFFDKFFRIEKRLRFVISCMIMGGLMLFSTFFFFDKAWLFIPLLAAASYFLTYFAILEGLEKLEWGMLFLMPVVLTISFYLFYFLFPGRWLTRVPFIAFYGISFYAILLCSNIFNVGVEKNLQLYRAAFSVNFFYQIIVAYLLFNNFFSQKMSFLLNGVLAGVVGFILASQLFWTVRLNLYVESINVRFGLLVGVILLELATVFSFVPVTSSVLALFLSASYYSLAGLIFHFLDQRLFKETIREYLIVFGFVLAITVLSISW